MMLMPFDYTIVFLIPAVVLSLYAQFKVKSTFEAFSNTTYSKGLTGAQVAKSLLENAGIYDVKVEHISGNLTDHYDPRGKVLRLSDSVYNSTSIAAIGVAAHETGHALQHDESYVPLQMRSLMVPFVNISSQLSMPLIFIGLAIAYGSNVSGGSFGNMLLNFGIILFSVVVLFQLITLPVEFNASSRAIAMLESTNILTPSEVGPAKKVLNAAALTYVAAAAVAISNLIRFLIMARDRR